MPGGPPYAPSAHVPPWTSDRGYPDTYVSTYSPEAPPIGHPPDRPYQDPWYLHMFAATFAWVAASTGTATYNTWVTRVTNLTEMDHSQTKTWGELHGGIQQSYLYYRHGGTVRGTPGVHPTTIVNPPLQATLG